MTCHRKRTPDTISRAVVKVGSNVLTARAGLNIEAIDSISSQICRLLGQGIQIILVSSGAMASGMKKMGFPKRPEAIPKRQAISAIGQAGLIREWEKAFARFDRKVAQILLTSDDLTSRNRYLNARNTLNTLLEWQVVPIINENDTIMVEEIKLGDNDNLAAMIALLLDRLHGQPAGNAADRCRGCPGTFEQRQKFAAQRHRRRPRTIFRGCGGGGRHRKRASDRQRSGQLRRRRDSNHHGTKDQPDQGPVGPENLR